MFQLTANFLALFQGVMQKYCITKYKTNQECNVINMRTSQIMLCSL